MKPTKTSNFNEKNDKKQTNLFLELISKDWDDKNNIHPL